MKYSKEYTTFMPVLIRAIQNTKGSVLELGAGLFSTPLLHWLCAEEKRELVTYEDVEKYYNFANRFSSRNHKIHFVKNWEDIDIDKRWSVVLIDHKTERRIIEAIRLKDFTDYIILHDADKPHYEYDKLNKHFLYIDTWKFCKPWTMIISNKHQITKNILYGT